MHRISLRQWWLAITGIALACGCALSGFALFGEAPETEKQVVEKLPLMAPMTISFALSALLAIPSILALVLHVRWQILLFMISACTVSLIVNIVMMTLA